MLWRQLLLRGTRLDRPPSISPLATALRISLAEARPAGVGRRRWLASISPPVSTSTSTFTHQRGNLLVDTDSYIIRPTALDELLRSIRCRDAGGVISALYAWIASLANADASIANAAHQELAELPVPTFSEILRALDPVANRDLDVAHGIHISPGEMQFTNACHLVDEFGVRHQHRNILNAVKFLALARCDSHRKLVISDYEILFRLAGAAGDIEEAISFFGLITKHGLAAKRTTTTWNEFFKARYQTDPLYYQYHRQRVLYTPRHGYKATFSVPLNNVWRLESLRHSRNALLKTPFNRQRNRLYADNMLRMRKKDGYFSFFAHWRRSKAIGVLLNEEILCTALIAFARSASLQHMRGIVLKRGFGIGIKEDKETGEFSVIGKMTFRSGNPRAPTERLLNAIVEAFGSMMRIRLASQLLIHVSSTQEIPIPRETWCNLFNWAYVCGAKSNQRGRRFMNSFPHSSGVDPAMITEIWDTMTSKPYNIEPTFESYINYIKVHIFRHKFSDALDLIRDHAIRHYRSLEKEHQRVVFEEVLQEVSEPSHRRIAIETQKEHAWYQISKCLDQFLDAATKNSRKRKGKFSTTALPHIIAEFSEFFHDQIQYRTAQGYVRLKRSVDPQRFTWEQYVRTTLPQFKGGLETQSLTDLGLIEEEYQGEEEPNKRPMLENREMNVLDWKRIPCRRTRAMGPAPESTDVNARGWWKRLEQELMT
ncbi:hypothetical protein F53441_3500 [Fusarium austroafricanum]|uniref:Mitochondrial ATPase expression-domain-containing protein n=1 Tax=Fusarium austroafricanum TaxID=2364996 RepID=A0A8H4NZY9_9HYPO|nr:hypothetical protein F53441_3500 [Fusarium austroafricanum]